ncbi:MAG TPA: RIP metalloprotease RseP [Thermoanaerobaculia bacterium]|nr:RIP metalloprotease RseP [Thermoanaerobaculia bacterium]
MSFHDLPWFLLVLGIIIFVHEGGHYLMAKLFDVKVLTFSLGFGPKIFSFRRGETEYRVSWLPLGGYVRLGGESPEESTGDPRDFQCKPRWQRVLVYLAGPMMNVVFSIIVVAAVLVLGFPLPFFHNVPPVVGIIEPGSPGAQAGLLPGDKVIEVRGREAENWEMVAMAVLESPGKPVPMKVERGGKQLDFVVVPATVPQYEVGDAGLYPKVLPNVSRVVENSPALAAGFREGDKVMAIDGRPLASSLDFVDYVESHAGKPVVITVQREGRLVDLHVTPRDEGGGRGRVGVELTEAVRLPPWDAVVESVRYNWNITTQTLALVGKLLTGEMKAQTALHGPLEIGKLAGEAARQGYPSLFHLTALVSISIAILNLLPIPVLDGGQIFVLLLESLLRRDLSLRLKEAINMVGLAFILVLMVTVIYFDVRRGWFSKPPPPTAAAPAAGAPPVALPSPVPSPAR